MVAQEFLKFVGELKITEYMGVEDFADKLSFQYSVLVLMLCTTIVSVKQYLSSSIACYIPTGPSGTDFDKYIENYCWVHGTIPILSNEEIPQMDPEWDKIDQSKRINYYQWVPFMLGLQTLFFHMPRLVWQLICYNRTGTDIENLVGTAGKASRCIGEDRKGLVSHVAGMLESMLYQHRDYRQGKVAEMRRKTFSFCGIFVASKRLGTWLVFTYLVIKLLYLGNAVGQLYLMQYFLGFNDSFTNFGISLANFIATGRDWETTRIFPRVSICYVSDVRLLGGSNKYTAQCALPVNMLNEKLYIFLWFWTCMVAICTALSIPTWILRMSIAKSRTNFIKKFIKLRKQIDENDKKDIHHFIREFLRHDGVFLLRMIALNAGDVVTADIVQELYDIHNSKYRQRNMLKDFLPKIKEAIEPDYPTKMKDGFGTAPLSSTGSAVPRKPTAPRASDV